MKRVTIGCVALVLALLGCQPVWAQTILNNTTLTTNLTSVDTQVVVVASTTNILVGHTLYIDQEAMQVNTVVSSTQLRVTRGVRGTRAALHGATSPGCQWCGVAFNGPPNAFKTYDPTPGYCLRANIDYIPWINVSNGNNWTCIYNSWRGTNVAPFTFNSVQTAEVRPPVSPLADGPTLFAGLGLLAVAIAVSRRKPLAV